MCLLEPPLFIEAPPQLDSKGFLLSQKQQYPITCRRTSHRPGVPCGGNSLSSSMVSPVSQEVIALREDVLTRAAALDRGAATTGFKRFLALTESAKDLKDGPFRKLSMPRI
ncbi:hypothetical protein L6452_33136 [Arctium lappa]|uniref:Uncharacterized protein n=1 Tax=Arctium lappa TaxID=4217 RepID=A0ACB8Z696_ARCLA|nr:hypothetical protein L6452_33136 [Arctium lappa]